MTDTKDLQSLYVTAAAELSKSPIFARALADRIGDSPELLKQLVAAIDPQILGTAIAEFMVRIGTSNRRYDTDIWDNYRYIVKSAQDKAATILAQDIVASHVKKVPKPTTQELTELEKMRQDVTHA